MSCRVPDMGGVPYITLVIGPPIAVPMMIEPEISFISFSSYELLLAHIISYYFYFVNPLLKISKTDYTTSIYGFSDAGN